MKNPRTLNQLEIGAQAKIKALHTEGAMKRRFLDIGLIQNSNVKCVLESPLGDPKAYEIRGTLIAIREEDAATIELEDLYE